MPLEDDQAEAKASTDAYEVVCDELMGERDDKESQDPDAIVDGAKTPPKHGGR